MDTLTRISDRMLARLVPRTVASASFTQYCGCYRMCPPGVSCVPDKMFFRTCEWQPGGGYSCGPCAACNTCIC